MRTPGPAGWETLRRRWPTGLALLLTIDHLVEPSPVAWWTILILPTGYLLIGAYRRRFGDRKILAVQVAGLLAYVALAIVAQDE